MVKKRWWHSADFKFRIALEGLEGIKKIIRFSSEYKIHANKIRVRSRQLPKDGPSVFNNYESLDSHTPAESSRHALIDLNTTDPSGCTLVFPVSWSKPW
jgi:transposase-like protein